MTGRDWREDWRRVDLRCRVVVGAGVAGSAALAVLMLVALVVVVGKWLSL